MGAGAEYKKKVRDSIKEREHIALLKHRYDTRITNVKIGKAAFSKGDFLTAIKKYTEYLETVAEVNKISGIYDLHPGHFDKNKDLTEMLMISHLYFELAKFYDATGKFQQELARCLDQFVLFSANQPFQVVNSEMCRKHLRKFKFKNRDLFMKAYQQLFVKSRKCFIATHCFGEEHPETELLRHFKLWLLDRPGGLILVETYYVLSPKVVSIFDKSPLISRLLTPAISTALKMFSTQFVRRILIK